MKLDIQRFSGGSYDYKYLTMEEYYVGRMYDIELNDLMKDIIKLLHDLEWWQSGDYGENDYRKSVIEFKQKWFTQNRNDRLKTYIDESLEQKRKELYDLIGDDKDE